MQGRASCCYVPPSPPLPHPPTPQSSLATALTLRAPTPGIPAAASLFAHAVTLSTAGGMTWYDPDGLTYTLLVEWAARAVAASPRGGEAAEAAVDFAEAVVADMEATAMTPAAAATERRDPASTPRVLRVHTMLPAYSPLVKEHRHWEGHVDAAALARTTLSRLTVAGVAPDVVTYNSLFGVAATTDRGLAAAAGLAVAFKLLPDATPAAGVVPDPERTSN